MHRAGAGTSGVATIDPIQSPSRQSVTTPPASGISELWLKVTPPRVPRHLLARPRLLSSADSLADRPVILVQAPAGFGKTSLLAQWRLEHLAQGTVVAWLSAQPRDDPIASCKAWRWRSGWRSGGRPSATPCSKLLRRAGSRASPSGWPNWRRRHCDVVLFVDEADSLPAASREALAYLLRNAPPNLRCVIAARPDCRLDIDDLVAYGQCIEVGPAMLRFRLEESLELVRVQLGARIDNDTAARLHELTEGWPLGLQLALSAICGGRRPARGGVRHGRARRRAARAPGRRAARQPGPGGRGLPDPHLDPRGLCTPTCAAAVTGDDERRRGSRAWAATRRCSSPASRASGCACTRWRARRCASASRRCPPPSRRSAARARGGLAGRARPARSGGAPRAGGGPAREGLRAGRAQPLRIA